jgi:anti-sigma B factor antagonist
MTDLRAPEFRADIVSQGDETIVRVAGEIDVATAPVLRDVLDLALERGRILVVDIAAVDFMDSCAADVLEQAAVLARAGQGSLTLRNPTRMARKLLGLLGLEWLLAAE